MTAVFVTGFADCCMLCIVSDCLISVCRGSSVDLHRAPLDVLYSQTVEHLNINLTRNSMPPGKSHITTLVAYVVIYVSHILRVGHLV
jgi:hypothetical protein